MSQITFIETVPADVQTPAATKDSLFVSDTGKLSKKNSAGTVVIYDESGTVFTPTGTGLPHVVAGVMNAAASLIVAADITNATITDTQVAAANKDGAAGTASMRTLGYGTYALRPAANTVPAGYVYWATDLAGGRQSISDGAAWVSRDVLDPKRNNYHLLALPGTGTTPLVILNGNVTGVANPVSSGTQSRVQTTTRDWINLVSSGVGTGAAGFVGAAATSFRTTRKPVLESIIMPGQAAGDLTNIRLRFGLYAVTPPTTDAYVGNCAGFRYCPGADGTAFWRTETADGAAATVNATSVAIAINTEYKLMIDAFDPTSIKFYINDLLVATHTTNLPSTTADLLYQLQSNETAAAAINLLFYRFWGSTN